MRMLLFLLALLCTSRAQLVNPANFANSLPTPGGLAGYTLYWNTGASFIDFGIVATTVGWVGFGEGSNLMAGANIVWATTDVTKRVGTGHSIPGAAPTSDLTAATVQRTATETHVLWRQPVTSIPPGVRNYIAAYHPTSTDELAHPANTRISFQATIVPIAVAVAMSDTAFAPTTLTVEGGTEVSFRNTGTTSTHVLTCPTCPEVFTSPDIAPNQVYRRTFTTQGTYDIVDSVGLPSFRLTVGAAGAPPQLTGASRSLMIAHAVIMSLTWLVLAPFGLYMALLEKEKHRWWFPVHWVVGGLVALFSMIALVLIVLHVQNIGGGHFLGAAASATKGVHSIFGLIALFVVVAQIVFGAIIHFMWGGPGSGPTVMEIIHWWMGRSLLVVAAIAIILGVIETRGSIGLIAIPIVWIVLCTAIILNGMRERAKRNRYGGSSASYQLYENH